MAKVGCRRVGAILCATLSVPFSAGLVHARPNAPASWRDPSPHRVRFVAIDPATRLEVLDWGGRGETLVLLAGLGNSAHVFDDFAPKLVDRFQVIGLTRRGT